MLKLFKAKAKAVEVPVEPRNWRLIIHHIHGRTITFTQTFGESDVMSEAEAWKDFKVWYEYRLKNATYTIKGRKFSTIVNRSNIAYIEIRLV